MVFITPYMVDRDFPPVQDEMHVFHVQSGLTSCDVFLLNQSVRQLYQSVIHRHMQTRIKVIELAFSGRSIIWTH